MIVIKVERGLSATKRDFGVHLVTNAPDVLEVPESVGKVLDRCDAHTAVEFLSVLSSFPGEFARDLGWELDEVRQAHRGLAAQLRGRVPVRFLEIEPAASRAFQRGMGARPPRGDRERSA